jgi:GNAT superfamily N-acetyltransferase/DNA-binding MarR family transcriptional regulator
VDYRSRVDTNLIENVRRFNRTVTARVGALNDRFLGRGHPLGHARVLWELGDGAMTTADLAARTSLEADDLLRFLRALEEEGLIERDGVDSARLSEAGRAERQELDRRSHDLGASLLDPLSDRQRERLVAAMAEVERLMLASMVEIAPADATSADARWCIDQYFAELDVRFEAGFDPSISISADAAELTPPAGLLLLARLRGRPIGCGALKLPPGAPAQIKRMWMAREARGLGLGRRMLAELERRAAALGVELIQLETNHNVSEAIALYRSAGYRQVPAFSDDPYADHWFEKRLEPTGD